MILKCKRCNKSILTKNEFIKELSEEYGIEVDPYNADKFKVSGMFAGLNMDQALKNARITYEKVQKKRAFKCRNCGNTYCMECLLNYAPVHSNGGKACLSCHGEFIEI